MHSPAKAALVYPQLFLYLGCQGKGLLILGEHTLIILSGNTFTDPPRGVCYLANLTITVCNCVYASSDKYITSHPFIPPVLCLNLHRLLGIYYIHSVYIVGCGLYYAQCDISATLISQSGLASSISTMHEDFCLLCFHRNLWSC